MQQRWKDREAWTGIENEADLIGYKYSLLTTVQKQFTAVDG